MKKTVAIILCAVLLILSVACGSKSSDPFAGKWKYVRADMSESDNQFGDLAAAFVNAFDLDVTMTFDGKGNGVNQAAAMEANPFTYSFDEKTLTIDYGDDVVQVYEYLFDGDEMRLISDGTTIIYQRQN